MNKKYFPRLIAWEVTRKCTLNCKHCRASAENKNYHNELKLNEFYQTLDNISKHYDPIIILTGGDPMMKKDIYKIIKYGASKNLKVVIALCGHMINKNILIKLKDSGIKRISLSLDGAKPGSHDNFRGVSGSYNQIIKTMKLAHEIDLPFQINTTVTKYNIKELSDILNIAVQQKAVSFHPFLLVPTGKAKNMINMELSPEEYEKTLNWIYDQNNKIEINFKPTCAPHYYRIYKQRQKKNDIMIKSSKNNYNAMSKGCMGGHSFAFISHSGKLQICGFLDIECGDLRKENYNFKSIWDNSQVFKEIRDLKSYHGKCGVCEYQNICGGCRARAHGITGDYLDEEPYCVFIPKRIKEITNKHL